MLSSPYYKSAHGGDLNSAFKLIDGLEIDFTRFTYRTGFVCPVQRQSKGNQIPVALAVRICQNSGLKFADHIYLHNERPGTKMAARLNFNPHYFGLVQTGDYILVDDFFTTGITLKGLKTFIEQQGNGSSVHAAYTLGNSVNGLNFEPTSMDIKILVAKFPDIDTYYDLDLMTWAQAKFMLRFPTLNSFHRYVGNASI